MLQVGNIKIKKNSLMIDVEMLNWWPNRWMFIKTEHIPGWFPDSLKRQSLVHIVPLSAYP